MPIPIFLETETLLVVDKPAGWLTTPARLADDPRPCLGRELQTQAGRQIYPVHRLDFEVSGLTVWAKTADAHRAAQDWFEDARVRILYEALCTGGPGPVEWVEWRSKLARGKKRAFVAGHGKLSVTLARQTSRENSFYKWELVAVTGRPHQLRFEMSAHGFALLGDTLYGGAPYPEAAHWIGLRAVELDLSALPESERLGLPAVCRVDGLKVPQ
jgi:tRNA pseudouridine32 synthase/23S rRNA pseudouridine746 synthase